MYELDLIWGWQPALYLFLGGLGAGTFLAAALLLLRGGGRYKKLVSVSSFIAFACVAVGLLLLLAELIKPLSGLMVWQSFSNFTSWMTYGAWIAMGAMGCFIITGLLCSPWLDRQQSQTVSTVTKVFTVLGALFAFALAFYTGMLLMSAPGVAFWRTGLLPCLFTVSALDTGVALVELIALSMRKTCALSEGAERALRLSSVCLIVLELIVLAVFLGTALTGTGPFGSYAATAAVSANFVVAGGIAVWFWGGVVVVGLVLPLALLLALLRRKEHSLALAALVPLCILIGGCILRFVVLLAGVHVDLVGAVVATL